MICCKIAIHCVCKLWTGMMIFRFFFQFLDISMPPGGQIQKSILLKWSTPIHFMIVYKIAIHCVCKLWAGTMILWFFPKSSIFRKQRWLPVGHFGSDDLVFWYACRVSNATHSCKISNHGLYNRGMWNRPQDQKGRRHFPSNSVAGSGISRTSPSRHLAFSQLNRRVISIVHIKFRSN